MIAEKLRRLDRGLLGRLLKDSTLAGLGNGLNRLFLFTLNVIVARMLDQRGFGVFSTVYQTVNVVAMFAGLGLNQTASRSIAVAQDDPARRDRVTRTMLLLLAGAGALAALVMWVFSEWIQRSLNGRVPIGILQFGAYLVALQLFAGGVEGVLRGLNQFRWIPLAALGAGAAGLIAARPLITSFSVIGGLGALLIFLLVQSLLSLAPFAVRLIGPMMPLADAGRLVGGVALPTFMSSVAWNVAMMIPPLMLMRREDGPEQMALWSAANQLRFLISFAPLVIVNTFIPHLARLHERGELGRKQAATSVGLSMVAALAPYLPVLALSGWLMKLYGENYGQHGALLVICATGGLLQVLGTGLFGVILATGRVWQAAILNACWCAAVLGLSPGLIERGGANHLAWLYVWSYLPVIALLALLGYLAVSRKTEAASAFRPASAES